MAIDNVAINNLIESAAQHYKIDSQLYNNYQVKRGLRNPDGTGVLAGLTSIGEVRGYIIDNGERVPIEGKLLYRGVNTRKIIEHTVKENRHGFEETVFLLLFGFFHIPLYQFRIRFDFPEHFKSLFIQQIALDLGAGAGFRAFTHTLFAIVPTTHALCFLLR